MIHNLYVWHGFLDVLGEEPAEFARLDVGFEVGDEVLIREDREDEPVRRKITSKRPMDPEGSEWVILTVKSEVERGST